MTLSELTNLSKKQIPRNRYQSIGYGGGIHHYYHGHRNDAVVTNLKINNNIEHITKVNIRRLSNQRNLNAGLGIGKSSEQNNTFMVRSPK